MFEPLNILLRVVLTLVFLLGATKFLTKRSLSKLTISDDKIIEKSLTQNQLSQKWLNEELQKKKCQEYKRSCLCSISYQRQPIYFSLLKLSYCKLICS